MAASQSTPFVVPTQSFPQTESVTQDRLAEIINLRHEIEQLEMKLGEFQTEVKAALESGAEVEPGLFRATLKTTERRSVAWKVVCERELGDTYCARVLAATKPDSHTHLIVTA